MDKFTACCCCSRRSSSITVGILSVIGLIIAFIFQCITISKLNTKLLVDDSIAYKITKAYFVTIIFLIIIRLIICSFLILGSVKRIQKFIFPYVCIGFTEVIYGLPYTIYQIYLLSLMIHGSLAIILSLIHLAVIAILMYFWIVVYYFYIELQREQSEEEKMTRMSNCYTRSAPNL